MVAASNCCDVLARHHTTTATLVGLHLQPEIQVTPAVAHTHSNCTPPKCPHTAAARPQWGLHHTPVTMTSPHVQLPQQLAQVTHRTEQHDDGSSSSRHHFTHKPPTQLTSITLSATLCALLTPATCSPARPACAAVPYERAPAADVKGRSSDRTILERDIFPVG